MRQGAQSSWAVQCRRLPSAACAAWSGAGWDKRGVWLGRRRRRILRGATTPWHALPLIQRVFPSVTASCTNAVAMVGWIPLSLAVLGQGAGAGGPLCIMMHRRRASSAAWRSLALGTLKGQSVNNVELCACVCPVGALELPLVPSTPRSCTGVTAMSARQSSPGSLRSCTPRSAGM